MADHKDYPKFVRVHESHIEREQRKPNADFSLIHYDVAATEHVTAGPMFAKFFVQKDGSVDVYVTDAKEEALAISPKR